MNAYLKKRKTPAQTTLKNSHATDAAIEDDFFEVQCDAVRERRRSSSRWMRSSFLDILLGGGKVRLVMEPQVNISGVNGLPVGSSSRGTSNPCVDTNSAAFGMAFPRWTAELHFSRFMFASPVRLADASVMPNGIGLFFLFFICHLDILFLILTVIYRAALTNNVSQNEKPKIFLIFLATATWKKVRQICVFRQILKYVGFSKSCG